MRSFGVFVTLGAAVAVALGPAGCAKAGLGSRDGGGSGGELDMSAEPTVDLAGYDLTGLDLRPDPRDLAGADLRPPVCTVFPQSGCGAGEKCTLVGGGNAMCATDGNKAVGQQCGATADDCVKGALCTSESPTIGQCRAFCGVDTDCAQSGAKCLLTLDGTTQKVCTVPCTPTYASAAAVPSTSGCAASLGCELFGLTGGGQGTDCTVRGSGRDGASCATNGNADCAAGFTCVTVTLSGGGTVKKCRGVCRISAGAADCAGLSAGYVCLEPTAMGSTYGFCCSSTVGCQ